MKALDFVFLGCKSLTTLTEILLILSSHSSILIWFPLGIECFSPFNFINYSFDELFSCVMGKFKEILMMRSWS